MFNILAAAYAAAIQDGATAEAEIILAEMEEIAGIAERDRVETEKAKNWRVG